MSNRILVLSPPYGCAFSFAQPPPGQMGRIIHLRYSDKREEEVLEWLRETLRQHEANIVVEAERRLAKDQKVTQAQAQEAVKPKLAVVKAAAQVDDKKKAPAQKGVEIGKGKFLVKSDVVAQLQHEWNGSPPVCLHCQNPATSENITKPCPGSTPEAVAEVVDINQPKIPEGVMSLENARECGCEDDFPEGTECVVFENGAWKPWY